MTGWQVRRQDDSGNEYLVATYHDRVLALARLLTFEAGQAHKQLYWVDGPATPALGGSRDLGLRLVELGRSMAGAGRTLDEFLAAWWWASRPLADRNELDLDSVAAMFVVAAQAAPPARPAALQTRSYDSDELAGYAGWEAVLLSQLADLADLSAAGPLPERSSLGIEVTRPAGVQRITSPRWFNTDPESYLECGVAGWLDGADPMRQRSAPADVLRLPTLRWPDLANLAICGQAYE